MKKSILVLLLLTLTLQIVLTACSPDETSQGSNQNDGETNLDEDVVENLTEMPDRPFVYLSQQVVETIDPAIQTDETSLHAVLNTYDPLVYPKMEESSMEAGPNIAETWEISDDGKTYTFHLNEGISFHSGNEVTAKDVVFSMQRTLSLKQGYSWLWEGLLDQENVKELDEYVVEFELNEAYAPFISTLTQLFVIDSETVLDNLEDGNFGEYGDYGVSYLTDNTAGSGPYMIDSWERGSEMRLSQFTDYWKGWSDDQIEEISYQIVEEEATVRTMLAAGEADMANQWLSISTFEDLKNIEGIIVEENPSVQIYHLPMNTQKPPFDDINVRKAVLYAFDYQTANEEILNGATQAQGPVPVLTPGHNENVDVYQQDLEKAKEYLNQSDYAGQDLTVEHMYVGEQPIQRQIGVLLQNNLNEIGIEVELTAVPWAQITEAASSVESTPNFVNVYDSLKYPHVDSHSYGIYHSSAQNGSYRTTSWYENPQVSEILEQARVAVDQDEQFELYKEAQQLIVEDAVSIYISNPTHRMARRDYVEGYTYNGLTGFEVAFYHLSVRK